MSEASTVEKTAFPLKIRLYTMMFLQYFVQGCYLPVVSVYLQDSLGFSGIEIGAFGSALAVGPLFMPFLMGQAVDRHLPSQWVLAFCHLVGGLLMLGLYFQEAFPWVILLGTLYSILNVPTLMLTNSVTFYHLKDRDNEFPLVRLWGTIGFILPAWIIELYFLANLTGNELEQARGIVFLLAGIFGLIMAVYCLTLPATPPQPTDATRFAPGVVVALFRRRDFLVLTIVGIAIAICHKFYFVWNSPYLRWFLDQGGIHEAVELRISSIGQICEIIVMAGLGRFLVHLGYRWVFTLGLSAYLVRCLIFAGAAAMCQNMTDGDINFGIAMLLIWMGQALHGYSFVCFWAAAFVYVDQMTPPQFRGYVQTFFVTVMFGFGMVLAGFISGAIGDYFKVGTYPDVVRDWSAIWLVCGVFAGLSLLGFLIFFPRKLPADLASKKQEDKSISSPGY